MLLLVARVPAAAPKWHEPPSARCKHHAHSRLNFGEQLTSTPAQRERIESNREVRAIGGFALDSSRRLGWALCGTATGPRQEWMPVLLGMPAVYATKAVFVSATRVSYTAGKAVAQRAADLAPGDHVFVTKYGFEPRRAELIAFSHRPSAGDGGPGQAFIKARRGAAR